MAADAKQTRAQRLTLAEQSRGIAAEARPTASAFQLAKLAADVAKALMDNYSSHLGRAMPPEGVANVWAEQLRAAAEREMSSATVRQGRPMRLQGARV